MRLLWSLLLSILVHSLLIFAFVGLKPRVDGLRLEPMKINLSFLRVREESRTEKEMRYKIPQKRREEKAPEKIEHRKNTLPEGETGDIKMREKPDTPDRTTGAKKLMEKREELRIEKPGIFEGNPQTGNSSEISERREISEKSITPEVSEKKFERIRPEPNPLPKGQAVQSGNDDLQAGSYEREYKEENLSRIREIIRSYLSYPVIARRMGWEGTVVVRFVLTPEGEVKKVNVEKSSGFEVLDRNALEVIKLASREFPKPRRDVVVVIPVVYRLEE